MPYLWAGLTVLTAGCLVFSIATGSPTATILGMVLIVFLLTFLTITEFKDEKTMITQKEKDAQMAGLKAEFLHKETTV